MPLYDYLCIPCGLRTEKMATIAYRHEQTCERCGSRLQLQTSAVYGKIAGQPVQGGGPDRFTADALGIPLKELPDSLKADRK